MNKVLSAVLMLLAQAFAALIATAIWKQAWPDWKKFVATLSVIFISPAIYIYAFS